MLLLWMTLISMLSETQSVGIMWRKWQLKREILVESRHCYLEVKVPERSTGVLGYWTLDVLHAHDMDRQHLNNLYVLARR